MTGSRMLTRTFLLVAALAAVLLASFGFEVLQTARAGASNASAAVGVRITMTVTGVKQGVFKGDDFTTTKGAQGQINVLAYSHEIVSPRDASSGQATGRPVWKPIVVTHLAGGSTPEFLDAAATNETLTKVVINFYHVTNRGTEVNYFRVTLTNAQVNDVRDYTSNDELLEDDSMVFEKITIEDLVAKTLFEDNFVTAT